MVQSRSPAIEAESDVVIGLRQQVAALEARLNDVRAENRHLRHLQGVGDELARLQQENADLRARYLNAVARLQPRPLTGELFPYTPPREPCVGPTDVDFIRENGLAQWQAHVCPGPLPIEEMPGSPDDILATDIEDWLGVAVLTALPEERCGRILRVRVECDKPLVRQSGNGRSTLPVMWPAIPKTRRHLACLTQYKLPLVDYFTRRYVRAINYSELFHMALSLAQGALTPSELLYLADRLRWFYATVYKLRRL